MRDLFSATIAAPADYVLSISDLALQIRRVLESDPILCDIGVRGEVSNFKAHGKGHLYFTLKDDAAQIRCCMWRRKLGNLAFRPTDGNRVVAWGRVEFYEARGEANFIVEELQFDGQGALYEAYEQLKQTLAEEGLFDPERKRSLPVMPRRIGLITSPTGAVAHDVISVLARRWPLATIVFIPAAVQGFSAAPDLIRALSWAAALDDLDVVIIGRGGGSAEDLWAFNDEDLARVASQFPKPLISAVGHETDFTILDFVADLRAPTPSAAAELVAPDIREVQSVIDGLRWRLHSAVAGDVRLSRQRLDSLLSRHVLTHPQVRLNQSRERVAGLKRRARDAAERRVKIERRTLAAYRAQLRALDPQRVLERGYALLSNAQTGSLITSVAQAQPGDVLRVTLQDGTIKASAEAVLKQTKEP
ncbi:MAG: exodeoxyribonuclease VII large subunit [Abitibacteriaceae bacterium]|nr:exodeoxyribonuclease VII large subunit [Abditibacteriaceae bacterium]MBV9864240.1 exodeoxyribonuclease VII large subunit [Abditibacteriaceae bacterium]